MKLKEKLEKSKKYQQYKEKKEAFSVIWNNPRYHAIIMLSFWFIIILILALAVRLKNATTNNIELDNHQEEQVEINETYIKNKLKEINSYDTVITLEKHDTIEKIEKTITQSEQLIKYQNNTYYFNDNLYNITNNQMIIDNNQILMDINYFNTFNIYELIKDLEEEYITIYSDNSYIINYKIPATNFLLDYNGTNNENNEFINISIEGNKAINKIKIDMTNINLVDPNFYIKTLTLELKNINEIDKININIMN